MRLTHASLPGYLALGEEALDHLVRERLDARDTEIRAEFLAAGRSFLGMEGVMRYSRTDRPGTRDPRRGINPRVAGRDKDVRVNAVGRWLDFLKDYRRAWLRWRGGD